MITVTGLLQLFKIGHRRYKKRINTSHSISGEKVLSFLSRTHMSLKTHAAQCLSFS